MENILCLINHKDLVIYCALFTINDQLKNIKGKWHRVYRTKGGKNQISELKLILKQVLIPFKTNNDSSEILPLLASEEKILQIDLKKFTCHYLYKLQGEDGCPTQSSFVCIRKH